MTEFEQFEKEMLGFINSSGPEIQSLLYDLDLMPEQLTKGGKEWGEMLNIAQHMKLYGDRLAKSVE